MSEKEKGKFGRLMAAAMIQQSRGASHQGPVPQGSSESHFRKTGVTLKSKYQGPVRPGDDEKHFRSTGETKPKKTSAKAESKSKTSKPSKSKTSNKINKLLKKKFVNRKVLRKSKQVAVEIPEVNPRILSEKNKFFKEEREIRTKFLDDDNLFWS